MQKIVSSLMVGLLLLGCYGVQQRDKKSQLLGGVNRVDNDNQPKQEQSKRHDWVGAWEVCGGDIALKQDGSLWQFGKIGRCDWGSIHMHDQMEYVVYHLKPQKIGEGFKNAKVINGGYRLYLIKEDGTLWGVGEGLGTVVRQIGEDNDWAHFSVVFEGNGCCAYDIGMKKDGTLWRFPEFFDFSHKKIPPLKPMSPSHHWEKFMIDCCTFYGQKSDGTLWTTHHDEEHNATLFQQITHKDKLYSPDINTYEKLRNRMKELTPLEVEEPEIKAKKDGTLWLPPKIDTENVRKG